MALRAASEVAQRHDLRRRVRRRDRDDERRGVCAAHGTHRHPVHVEDVVTLNFVARHTYVSAGVAPTLSAWYRQAWLRTLDPRAIPTLKGVGSAAREERPSRGRGSGCLRP